MNEARKEEPDVNWDTAAAVRSFRACPASLAPARPLPRQIQGGGL